MIFNFYCIFSIKFLIAKKIAPDVTPRFVASHLGLYCLPVSHEMNIHNDILLGVCSYKYSHDMSI